MHEEIYWEIADVYLSECFFIKRSHVIHSTYLLNKVK